MGKRVKMRITVSLMLLLTGLIVASAQSVTPFYGDIVLFGGDISAPPQAHSGLATVYEVEVLGSGEGNSIKINLPLYNLAVARENNLTLIFEGDEEAYQGLHRIGPIMVKVEQDIEGVYVLSSKKLVNVVAAEVGGNATLIIDGDEVVGDWDDNLGSWIVELNSSIVQVFTNNTALYFRRVLDGGGSNVTLNLRVRGYTEASLELSQGRLFYSLYGPTVLVEGERKEISLNELDSSWSYFWYTITNRTLVRARMLGAVKYVFFTPDCIECSINTSEGEVTYVFDGTLRQYAKLDFTSPNQVIGGSFANLTINPPTSVQKINVLLPGGEGIIYSPGNFSLPLSVRFYVPPTTQSVKSNLVIAWFSPQGVFGLSKGIKVMKAVGGKILNGSQVILVKGRGEIHILLENNAPNPVRVVGIRMTLSSDSGSYQLVFPAGLSLYRNHSKVIALPLSLDEGTYKALVEADLTDPVVGRNISYTLGELTIKSIGQMPLKLNVTYTPQVPNVGDDVTVKVFLEPRVPVKNVKIEVRSEPGLERVTSQSKTLKEIKDKVVEEFKFKAIDPGTSKVIVDVSYDLPNGKTENVQQQISISVGGVKGKVYVSSNVTRVEVGKKFSVVVKVRDCRGKAEVYLPKGADVKKVNGILENGVVKFEAPGNLVMILSFNEPGNYTIPTYVSVNGSIIPTVPLKVEVVGKKSLKERRELISKVAELKRRFNTVKEALSKTEEEAVKKLETMFKELDEALDRGDLPKVERLISEIDRNLTQLERRLSEAGLFKHLMSLVLIGSILVIVMVVVVLLKFRGKNVEVE